MYVAWNVPSALILKPSWSCMKVNQDFYAKCAIKWSGRCQILWNAVESPDLDRLLRTLERQRYFWHFDQHVVLVALQHHKTNMYKHGLSYKMVKSFMAYQTRFGWIFELLFGRHRCLLDFACKVRIN